MLKKDIIKLDQLLKYRNPKEDGFKNSIVWKKKYYEELLDYEYIDTLQDFSILSKGGFIKIISLNTEMIKGGGIIIRIDKDENNRWYALIGIVLKVSNIKYLKKMRRVYFDNNYIFYKSSDKINISENKTKAIKYYLDKYLTEEEIYKYSDEIKKNMEIENLHNTYKKIKKN